MLVRACNLPSASWIRNRISGTRDIQKYPMNMITTLEYKYISIAFAISVLVLFSAIEYIQWFISKTICVYSCVYLNSTNRPCAILPIKIALNANHKEYTLNQIQAKTVVNNLI